MTLGSERSHALSDSPSSMVLLRWIIPADRYRAPREMIRTVVLPAVRESGWLSSPGTTYHVSDHGGEVWVTVITPLDDATDVQDDLAALLHASPVLETGRDTLLAPAADWYRLALQQASRVALDVIEARGRIPLSEYEAFESPADAALLLTRYLSGVSDTYRRACPTYAKTESFWTSFFRRGPASHPSRPGRVLWNLAG